MQLRGTGAHAIMINQCANVTLNGLTMHNVGMFWIIDWAGTGNTVRLHRLEVVPLQLYMATIYAIPHLWLGHYFLGMS